MLSVCFATQTGVVYRGSDADAYPLLVVRQQTTISKFSWHATITEQTFSYVNCIQL